MTGSFTRATWRTLIKNLLHKTIIRKDNLLNTKVSRTNTQYLKNACKTHKIANKPTRNTSWCSSNPHLCSPIHKISVAPHHRNHKNPLTCPCVQDWGKTGHSQTPLWDRVTRAPPCLVTTYWCPPHFRLGRQNTISTRSSMSYRGCHCKARFSMQRLWWTVVMTGSTGVEHSHLFGDWVTDVWLI